MYVLKQIIEKSTFSSHKATSLKANLSVTILSISFKV